MMSSLQRDVDENDVIANTGTQPERDSHNSLSIAQTETGSSSPSLPEIPAPDLDLSFSLESIIGSSNADAEKVQKRASNVLKLSQENEKLKRELKAMTDRLEAAERKRQELARREEENKAVPP